MGIRIFRNTLAVIIGFFAFLFSEVLAAIIIGGLACIPVIGSVFRFFASYTSGGFYNYATYTMPLIAAFVTVKVVKFIGVPNNSGIRVANIILGLLLCIMIMFTYISTVCIEGFSFNTLWLFMLKLIMSVIIIFCCKNDEEYF